MDEQRLFATGTNPAFHSRKEVPEGDGGVCRECNGTGNVKTDNVIVACWKCDGSGVLAEARVKRLRAQVDRKIDNQRLEAELAASRARADALAGALEGLRPFVERTQRDGPMELFNPAADALDTIDAALAEHAGSKGGE